MDQVLSALLRKPPPLWEEREYDVVELLRSPAVRLDRCPQTFPSGDTCSAQAWPWVSWRTTSPAGHRAGALSQPDGDRLLGVDQVHQHRAVECRAPRDAGSVRPCPHRGRLRIRTDALKAISGWGAVGDVEGFVGRSMHMPPPEPIPVSAVVGAVCPTVVGCSMRMTFPANDLGSAAMAGFPASPVWTTRVVGLVKINEPVFPTAPFGIPVSRSLGTSPSAIRITRLSRVC